LRDGRPRLDDARIARAIHDLEQADGHRLMEINQSNTELLLKGTVVDGLPDWDQLRPKPARYINFDNWASNYFLVINQFKVELTCAREHIIADAVLFGTPGTVGAFGTTGTEVARWAGVNLTLRHIQGRLLNL
jgi:type I restriction enzyme R subunit